MAESKGKCRSQEVVDIPVNTYSTIAASTKELARATFSTLSSQDLSSSSLNRLPSFGKVGLSSSQSARNHLPVGDDSQNLPKFNPSGKLYCIEQDSTENYSRKLEEEFSRFLGASSMAIKPSQSCSSYEKTAHIENPLFAQDLVENGEVKYFDINEQVRHDGEDVIRLLSNEVLEGYENEEEARSASKNIINASMFNNLEHSSSADSAISSPHWNNLSSLTSFRLAPNFGNTIAHDPFQWQELQEDYIEKVWGDDMSISSQIQSISEHPSKDKLTGYQRRAEKRLEKIWGHLQTSNTSF